MHRLWILRENRSFPIEFMKSCQDDKYSMPVRTQYNVLGI